MENSDAESKTPSPSPEQVAQALDQILCLLAKEVARQLVAAQRLVQRPEELSDEPSVTLNQPTSKHEVPFSSTAGTTSPRDRPDVRGSDSR